jgi:hypothetical protein
MSIGFTALSFFAAFGSSCRGNAVSVGARLARDGVGSNEAYLVGEHRIFTAPQPVITLYFV